MIENEERGERTVTVDQGDSNCHAVSETAIMKYQAYQAYIRARIEPDRGELM